VPVHLDADTDGIYADAFATAERELLAAAGFVETELARLRLPATRAPLDAMLAVEYAVDLLLGAGHDLTIGSAVTDALDRGVTNPPAEPGLFDTATAAAGHLDGEWKVEAFRHPLLASAMSWTTDSSRKRAAGREPTGAVDHVELSGPEGVRFMLAQPMDARQVTITPATPPDLLPRMPPPAAYRGKPAYAAAEPEAIAAELERILPAYRSAAHLTKLAVLSSLVRDLDGISTAWGAVEAAFAREPRPDNAERRAARQHRDRSAWKAIEPSTAVLRAVLDHSQRLLDEGQLGPGSEPTEILEDLAKTARVLGDRKYKQWTTENTSSTLEARIRAGDRMGGVWQIAESLRIQLPQLIALTDTASAGHPAASSRAQTARLGHQRRPVRPPTALVEGWKAVVRAASGRRR